MTRRQFATLAGIATAQGFASFGQLLMATLAGIIGAHLSPAPQLATLPVATGILGLACAALPAAIAIRRLGWRTAFIAALVWGALGAVVAARAITLGSFAGFCAGCFMLGNNMAVVAQYRFAAAALVPKPMISRAVAGVMLGTLVAATIAPVLALEFRHLFDAEFAGSFGMLLPFFAVAAGLLALLPMAQSRGSATVGADKSGVGNILRRPAVQLAIVAAAAGYGVMSLIMTATPISMHMLDGHSVDVTARVIRAHILAMFAPSLLSGWLIARLGIARMLWLGVLLELVCIAIAVSGHETWQYRAALVALGAGWNLLFVGATTLLTTVCTPAETLRVQGISELAMFSTMGAMSLSAGALLSGTGWTGTNLVALGLIALIVIAILRASPALSRLRADQAVAPADGG